MEFDTIIIGAGAAGLMCAAQASGRTLVVDHSKAAGEKIRISGGGRCNFTNMYAEPQNFISQNPHFAKSALARYTQWDFIDWVARSGIAYHEKTLGQLFCDHSAKDIIAMLLAGLDAAGADLWVQTKVNKVRQMDGGYALSMTRDDQQMNLTCRNLVVACGGKPIPKIGATDFGLRLAEQFGLPLTETYAGLVPYTFEGDMHEACRSLAGIAVDTTMTAGGVSFEEATLFTHRGISGPAALQTSSYWTAGQPISMSILSAVKVADLMNAARGTDGRKHPNTILQTALPSRLVPVLTEGLNLPERLADMTSTQLDALTQRCTNWQLTPAGTEGYRTAEVMVGGVDTNALNSKTMAAKDHPGLYFIGECVDVTGWLGGYNFQWAWSSGWAAAQAIKATI